MDLQKTANLAQVIGLPVAILCGYLAWVQTYGSPVPLPGTAVNSQVFWIAFGAFAALAAIGSILTIWQFIAGTSKPTPRKVGTFSTNLETTTAKEFFNETVILDGRQFDRCKFVNCRLEYHGTGNCNFIKCKFEGKYLLISPDEPCHVLFHIMTQLKEQSTGVRLLSRQNQRTGEIEPKAID